MTALNILLFSPGGTCRRVGQALFSSAGGRPRRFFDMTLPHQRKADLTFHPQDCLVLIFPVYAQRIPDPVRDYLKHVHGKNAIAVPIAVYGNIHPGHSVGQATRILTKQGFSVTAAAEIPAAHSYNHSRLSIAPGRPDEPDLKKAQAFLSRVLASADAGSRNPISLPALPRLAAVLPQKLLSHMAVKTPKLKRHLCTGCGRCKRACPTGAVTSGFSIKNRDCIRCTACIKACGVHARRLQFHTPIPLWYLKRAGSRPQQPRFFLAPRRSPKPGAFAPIPAADRV